MRISPTFGLLAASLVFGLNTHASNLQNVKDYPEWFQKAMLAEAELKKTTNIEIEALGMKGKVLGDFTLQDQDPTYWYYTVNIGSTTPIECYAFTSYDGPANSLHNIMAMSIENTAQASKMKLDSTVNFAVNSGVVDDTPFISADTLFTISDDKEVLSGVVKGRAAETSQSLQVCVHNEIGYKGTFNLVFSSFVEAFTKSEPDIEFFEVVYQMSVNGINAGFVEETYTTDADGDVQIKNSSVMLMPIDLSSFMRVDSMSESWSNSDGSLINANEYNVQNGVLASQFAIENKDGGWQVSGQMQGKEVNETLEHDGWLLSGYGSYSELMVLRSSEKTSDDYFMWSSSVDPGSAIQVKLSQIPNNPNVNFEVDMGPIVMQFLADEKGVFQKGMLNQGPLKLGMKLIHSRGAPGNRTTKANPE